MTQHPEATGGGKCALIVDFDNIYLGLRSIDRAAAETFATDPGRWLKWLERGMPERGGQDGESPSRAILIRHCYLNPNSFHVYRPYFTRTAFTVIDCPPLTTQGKTSADIRMVMDIVDILADKPWIDEFIIFSGDADFTPVLFRLRAHARRTTVLAIGPAAAAYVAACDRMIGEAQLIDYALEITAGPSAPARPAAGAGAAGGVLDEIAARVYQEASANGEILATQLPRLYKEFRQFRPDSNWLGYGSLRALSLAIAGRHQALEVTDETDTWRVVVKASASPGEGRAAAAGRPASATGDLEAKIIDFVKELVARSPQPVVMARAAQDVIRKFGPEVTATGWLGHGTFKELLQSVEDSAVTIFTSPGTPGFIYNPAHHEPPSEEGEDPLSDLPEDLAGLMRRVHRVTGTPLLRPDEYGVVFTAIADDQRRHPFSPNSTSKSVRDLCIESGRAISRANVLWILRGIDFAGYRFDDHDVTPQKLASYFRKNVRNLAENANLELSAEEEHLLDDWILGGGFATAAAAGPPGFNSSAVPG